MIFIVLLTLPNTIINHNKNQKYMVLFILIYYFHIHTTHSTMHPYISLLDNEIYTHQGKEVITNMYNIIEKNLTLNLIANNVQYHPNQKTISFTHPSITIFNNKNIAIWYITCNQAQLYHQKKTLNLHGQVFINQIVKKICTQSIITNQLLIDLNNQSIISNNKTIIHGHYFYSIGSCMNINLHTQTTTLFGKIYTQYEIQNM
ncbi:possible exported protein [Candidatus Blochmanniella floridana]|uniref:Possible exported protein n=1 Tax=Blochmanniella floridana TaxID=203907 RepID=Q7VQS2_BLOFL|nr:possible exported protein [Candidatus Blochmannia floridanus]